VPSGVGLGKAGWDMRGEDNVVRCRGEAAAEEEATMANFTLRVNGIARNVEAEPDTPLLYILRNDLELNGPKFGFDHGAGHPLLLLYDAKTSRS
jgi:hypothetical protein